MICWLTYQVNRGKDSPDRDVKDFLPDFDGERGEADRPTVEQLKAKLMGMTAAVGGRITTGGGGAAGG